MSKAAIKGKWNLSDNKRFRKVSALLDYRSGDKAMSLDQLLTNYCVVNFDKTSIKALTDFPSSTTIQFNKISSTGKSMNLLISDKTNNKTYQVKLKIKTKVNKIKSIGIEVLKN